MFHSTDAASYAGRRRSPKQGADDWTQERIEMLKRLWETGMSASQIASELGRVSRNAVIGKVHRLGLSGRVRTPSAARPRKARPLTKLFTPKPVQKIAPVAPAFECEQEPDPIVYDNVVPLSQRVSLRQLTDDNCHWPIGDPQAADFFFCGGPSINLRLGFGENATKLSYCAHHARIAYRPAEDRRKRPAPTTPSYAGRRPERFATV